MVSSEKILTFIRDELLDDDEVVITAETSLFQGRVLNSLSLVTLVVFLEDTFGIKVNTYDVTIENLDSVVNMLAFIDKKIHGN